MKIHGLHSSQRESDLDNLSLNQRILLLEASIFADKLKKIIIKQTEKIDALTKEKEHLSS